MNFRGRVALYYHSHAPRPAIGYAMVVFFFEDWLHHEYYSYECEDLERFRTI